MDQEFAWRCICKNENANVGAYEMISCVSCQGRAHAGCYEVYTQEARDGFLCLRCRITHNDPYIEIEECVCNPICFFSQDKVSQEVTFEISQKQFDMITKEKTLSIFAVFTRVIYDEFKYIEFPDDKNTLAAFLNGQPMTYHRRGKMVLDEFICLRKNRLKIASNRLNYKCVFAIYIGERIEIKDIAKRILKLKGQPTAEESKKNFESLRFKEIEVLAVIPVRDPITNQIIKVPARGSRCRHLQCFDLVNFLKFYQNPTDKLWKCFWCKNIIPWRELQIDQYLYGIIKNLLQNFKGNEEDINNICFDENGNWKLQDEFSKEWDSAHAENREKKEVNKKDRIEEEKDTQAEERQPVKKPVKTELSIDENLESFNTLMNQLSNYHDQEKMPEAVALKMRELNAFKNYTPYKFFEFLEKSTLLVGSYLPGLFEGDKYFYMKAEELGEAVFKKKLNCIIPITFSWAKKYDDLIVLILLIITKNKRTTPNFAVAIELILGLSWYMETRKISFEGIVKHNTMQLLGKLIHYLGEKLQWNVDQYAFIMAIFVKHFPQLHIPSAIPKRFSFETAKLFDSQADMIFNLMNGFTAEQVLDFLNLVYKPPAEKIPLEEEKVLRYFFYFFTLLFRKLFVGISDEMIFEYFTVWDKFHMVSDVLKTQGISSTNIGSVLF